MQVDPDTRTRFGILHGHKLFNKMCDEFVELQKCFLSNYRDTAVFIFNIQAQGNAYVTQL